MTPLLRFVKLREIEGISAKAQESKNLTKTEKPSVLEYTISSGSREKKTHSTALLSFPSFTISGNIKKKTS